MCMVNKKLTLSKEVPALPECARPCRRKVGPDISAARDCRDVRPESVIRAKADVATSSAR